MKKLLLTGMVILSGIALLTGCNKELQTSPETGKSKHQATARMSGANFAFDEHEECRLDGANCHSIPPIIITPDCLGAIAGAEACGKTTVGTVFSSSLLHTICAEMSLELEGMLQSGNYYIRKNYESDFVINYMIGLTYPVTVQNRTTAFQLHK